MKNIEKVREYTKDIRVLYVEDDEKLRKQTVKLMLNFFNSIDQAENGQAGFSMYKKEKYDIVITDISMPVMDGIELISGIKETDPDQNIIVTSAHDESKYLIKLLELGVNSFILKPLELSTFLKTIYSASKSIVDDRLIKEYQRKLEIAHIKLSKKTEALEKNNVLLKNKIDELETEKNKTIALVDAVENERRLSRNEVSLLSREYVKVSAEEFVSQYPTDLMLQNDKLETLDEKLDIIINRLSDNCGMEDIMDIANTFRLYGNIIDSIPEFSNIAYGLINLADAIQSLQEKDKERFVKYKDVLFTIAENINNWRITIFIKRETNSIHYLDNALISDCIQIEALLSGQEIEGEELELF